MAKKAAGKASARKAAARKPAVRKAGAKKATARKPAAKKATAKKASAKKATAKKASAKKAAAAKTAAKATSRKATSSRASAKRVVEEAPPPPPKKRKSPYTKTQLRPLKKALLERRARVMSDLGLLEDEALRAADPDVDAESVADHGSDAYERNLTLGLMEHDAQRVQEINTALLALEAGTYGLCEECDGAIPLPRLEALPFATTCVPCQEKKEQRF